MVNYRFYEENNYFTLIIPRHVDAYLFTILEKSRSTLLWGDHYAIQLSIGITNLPMTVVIINFKLTKPKLINIVSIQRT